MAGCAGGAVSLLRKESQAVGSCSSLGSSTFGRRAACQNLHGLGSEQLGEVHNLTLSKHAAAVAKMSLVTALLQANVRTTRPEEFGRTQLRLHSKHQAPGVSPRVA